MELFSLWRQIVGVTRPLLGKLPWYSMLPDPGWYCLLSTTCPQHSLWSLKEKCSPTRGPRSSIKTGSAPSSVNGLRCIQLECTALHTKPHPKKAPGKAPSSSLPAAGIHQPMKADPSLNKAYQRLLPFRWAGHTGLLASGCEDRKPLNQHQELSTRSTSLPTTHG